MVNGSIPSLLKELTAQVDSFEVHWALTKPRHQWLILMSGRSIELTVLHVLIFCRNYCDGAGILASAGVKSLNSRESCFHAGNGIRHTFLSDSSRRRPALLHQTRRRNNSTLRSSSHHSMYSRSLCRGKRLCSTEWNRRLHCTCFEDDHHMSGASQLRLAQNLSTLSLEQWQWREKCLLIRKCLENRSHVESFQR